MYLQRFGGVFGGDESHAGLCINCGKCVKMCPQKLDIPELLGDVSEELEGRGFTYKVKFMGNVAMPLMNAFLSLSHKLSRKSNKS